jgi:hypothetical protein
MGITYCSNSAAIKSRASVPLGALKPSKMPHIWTRRARKPRLVERKILSRRGIAVTAAADNAWPWTKPST